MTTDDNMTVSTTSTIKSTENQPTIVVSTTDTSGNLNVESKTTVEEPKTAEQLVNEAIDKFNSKIDDLLKAHKSETDQLKDEIDKKNEEIEKLKTINRNIIMSTDVSKNKEDNIDFSSVDFDEVDWNKETDAYFKTIDSKVF